MMISDVFIPGADAPGEAEQVSGGVSVFTLIVFDLEVCMWFSELVSERREALEAVRLVLDRHGVICRVVECLDGFGVDGGDIRLCEEPGIPDDPRVPPYADLE